MKKKVIDTDTQQPYPDKPCHNCGSTKYWWQQNNWNIKGNWLCSICHPNPEEEFKKWQEKIKEE